MRARTGAGAGDAENGWDDASGLLGREPVIRSMTGYGEADRETDHGRLRVEIRTVNHRFFNTSLKTPSGYERFHPQIERWLKELIGRGHLSYSLTMDRTVAPDEPGLELDMERARAYQHLMQRLAEELGLEGAVDLDLLTRFRDVIRPSEPVRGAPNIDEVDLRDVTQDAARAVIDMRESEGARLRDDLAARLTAIRDQLDRVEERAPERLLEERDRLRSAVEELLGDVPVDDERIAREIAHLAERWDINEEIVRFRSHLALFGETLEGDGSGPVGKRLGFIVQEMHREANTIGSKANDASIAGAAVAIKEEVERLREQLENVE